MLHLRKNIAGNGKAFRARFDLYADAGFVECATTHKNALPAINFHFRGIRPTRAILFEQATGDGKTIAVLDVQAVTAVGAKVGSAQNHVAPPVYDYSKLMRPNASALNSQNLGRVNLYADSGKIHGAIIHATPSGAGLAIGEFSFDKMETDRGCHNDAV